jgi:phosphate transport system ATP-binding protein
MAKIITKDLNLNVGELQILKNVNITIPENKITVILGPSGCGKTHFT